MFNPNNERNTYNFELAIWHHKLDEESLEDLQVEWVYRGKHIYDVYDPSESINCYLTLDAFGDISNHDEDYKEGLVYKTILDVEVTYYTNYCGEGDEDVYTSVRSHEIISANVDKWYEDNCKDNKP